ncbi:MAG TPA: ABC transporter substrate-binding protein [Lachnospiraceae bacterium]|nr:ABC transporter substrate-binding protein [Lachnospiraceae bacterium]
MSFKKNIKTITALSLLAVMTACSSANSTNSQSSGTSQTASSDDFVLKIAYSGSLCEAPVHVASTLGFFDEVGLKYEMVRTDAAQMPEAIGSDKVNAGFGLLGKYLQPIVENGLDMKITGGLHTGCTRILVPKDSDIKTVADLKGKKIGTTGLGAAAPTIVARRAMLHAGLNASVENCDAEFVVYGASDLAQALDSGVVDAIANGDPQAAVAQKEYNLTALVDTATSDDFKDEYCCISFVTGDIVEKHPEEAKKFTEAVLKAAQWVENHKEETALLQIEHEWVAGDYKANAEVLETYNYKPSLDGGVTALKATIPDLQEIGLISSEKTTDEIIEEITYHPEGLTDEEVTKNIDAPVSPEEVTVLTKS